MAGESEIEPQRFIRTARELSCDEDPEAFRRAVKKLAAAAPAPRRSLSSGDGEQSLSLSLAGSEGSFVAGEWLPVVRGPGSKPLDRAEPLARRDSEPSVIAWTPKPVGFNIVVMNSCPAGRVPRSRSAIKPA